MNRTSNLFVDDIQIQLKEPDFNGRNLTNRVLIQQKVHKQKNRNKLNAKNQEQVGKIQKRVKYFLPAYLWIRIKNFTNLDQQNLQAQINMFLDIAINMKGVPEILRKKIREGLVLSFNKEEALKLFDPENQYQTSMKKVQNDIEMYKVRKILKVGMKGEIRLAPFEIITLILSISMHEIQITKTNISSIIKEARVAQLSPDLSLQEKNKIKEEVLQLQNCKNIKFNFNFMNVDDDKFSKISYSDEGTFGNYDLAQRMLQVQYTNIDIPNLHAENQLQDEDLALLDNDPMKDYSQVEDFSYAHFLIPLYKYPMVGIVTIFVPLWMLGIINLGIFYQDTGLADRINSLAGLMLAFVALIPVIRDQLPPSPDITLVEVIVYVQTLTTIFCFAESIRVRSDSSFSFDWASDGFFIASVIILLLEVAVILFLVLKYFLRDRFRYNLKNRIKFFEFSEGTYKHWHNKGCDDHFRRKIDSREIQILSQKKKAERI